MHSLKCEFKDANRMYWRIYAENSGVDNVDKENDYFETAWNVNIRRSFSGEFDNASSHLVFNDVVYTQYDMPIELADILKEWQHQISCLCIDMATDVKIIQ